MVGHIQIEERWGLKPLHSQFLIRSKDAYVDECSWNECLQCSGLKGEIEEIILAAQDQSLRTRNQ